MARRRKRKKRHVNLQRDIQAVIGGVVDEIREEMISTLGKVADMAESEYRRELMATGLRPSDETGTKEKQSGKLKGRASHQQSMFDITSGVEQKGTRYYVRAGSRDSWVASFFNNNADHVEWGDDRGGMTKDELGFDAANFIDKAMKKAEPEAKAMLKRAFDRGLDRASRKQRSKHPTNRSK